VIFDQSRQCGLSILLHMTRRDFFIYTGTIDGDGRGE
jgi:hypothetical protein